MSTRAVDGLAKALGTGTGVPKSEVSRICADLDSMMFPPKARRSRTAAQRRGVGEGLGQLLLIGRLGQLVGLPLARADAALRGDGKEEADEAARKDRALAGKLAGLERGGLVA